MNPGDSPDELVALDIDVGDRFRQTYTYRGVLFDTWWREEEGRINIYIEHISPDFCDTCLRYITRDGTEIYASTDFQNGHTVAAQSWEAFLANPLPYILRCVLT